MSCSSKQRINNGELRMSILSKIPIFDIDTHFTEPKDLWTSRAPAKYKERVMHVRRDASGQDSWFIEGHNVAPIGPGVVNRQGDKVPGLVNLSNYDEMSLAATETPDRLKLMDKMGVAKQIFYPNVVGFGANRLMDFSDDADLRLWHATTYNDVVADIQKDSKGRILPQAVLPLWDIKASTKELVRIREKLGLCGIAMSDRPQDFKQPPLADPAWNDFFSACQDLEVPVNFHIGSGSLDHQIETYWGDRVLFRKDGSLNGGLGSFIAVSNFLANFKDIINLILTGMCDRFPRLKFVSVESGAGWIPFIIKSLEYSFEDVLTREERATFKAEPREYFKRQIYTSYWFENARAVNTYIEEFGTDNLMIETDFPHPQTLYPGLAQKIEETLGIYDEETQRKILYKNAEKVYGVKVAA